jgi:hypothetical protein
MAKFFWIGLVVLIGVASWQAIDGIMQASSLRTRMQDVLDNAKGFDENQIRANLLRLAQENHIALENEDIQVNISYHEKGGAAGGLTQKHGIQTTNKKITLTAKYSYRILGMTFDTFQTLETNYTTSATMPSHNYDNL